jgi:hypothetical protein
MAGIPAHDLGETLASERPLLLSADGPVLWKIRQRHRRLAKSGGRMDGKWGSLSDSLIAWTRSIQMGRSMGIQTSPFAAGTGALSNV